MGWRGEIRFTDKTSSKKSNACYCHPTRPHQPNRPDHSKAKQRARVFFPRGGCVRLSPKLLWSNWGRQVSLRWLLLCHSAPRLFLRSTRDDHKLCPFQSRLFLHYYLVRSKCHFLHLDWPRRFGFRYFRHDINSASSSHHRLRSHLFQRLRRFRHPNNHLPA